MLAVAVTTVLAACGGDGGEAGNAYSDAVAPQLFRGAEVGDGSRRCVAVELVDALGGPAAFEQAGVTPQELASAENVGSLGFEVGTGEATRIADALEPCGVPPVELLLAELDLPGDIDRCVEDKVDEAALRSFVVAVIVDGTADQDAILALVDPLLVCFPQ